MTAPNVSPNSIRAKFSAAMSAMYKAEVPAYGELISIVQYINEQIHSEEQSNGQALNLKEDTDRLSQERHGAIRLGTATELAMMARVFAVMGMHPVDYYDLSVASVPVHSTAFRPIEREDLAYNPFRVFTSLLRLELIEDETLRDKASKALEDRRIFSDGAIELTAKAEELGGLNKGDAEQFVSEVLETFRWHSRACVDLNTFNELNDAHRLIADVVSFKGPHINHLTPRTLNIDAAQEAMIKSGLPAKAIIEGPPTRQCPVLLRQTAFKAINEPVQFKSVDGRWEDAHHSARFGEIEQRGVALTPKGRLLYDELLTSVRRAVTPSADGSNADEYTDALQSAFSALPDDWRSLHDKELAYFKYTVTGKGDPKHSLNQLLNEGAMSISPIIYEDFLPVSAAGIFQSNLGDASQENAHIESSQEQFEAALGMPIENSFELYKRIQTHSLAQCLKELTEL